MENGYEKFNRSVILEIENNRRLTGYFWLNPNILFVAYNSTKVIFRKLILIICTCHA